IRIVGEPEQRIIRDPVRILRAIRHAARNGFTIEEKTLEAITNIWKNWISALRRESGMSCSKI
ncbi:MAG: polynucleotide adenylyltransferase, partial [Candidatus Electrothrix sp. AW1]|nr:polynucleotide adenylyltransferase [Candidatus Electrothrix gigas]